MSITRGKFITLEGPEGAGKTTQILKLAEVISSKGRQVVTTREPGGTEVAERIRALLLDPDNKAMGVDTETLLMFAARSDHLHHVIEPALARGEWVVCDRFTDATYAYQGGGRGVSTQRLSILEDWVQGQLRPDLCLVLDLDVTEGLRRARRRSKADRFELEQADFFERVRETYLRRASESPKSYRIINADQALEAVSQAMETALEGIL